jgi:hypothetical protein
MDISLQALPVLCAESGFDRAVDIQNANQLIILNDRDDDF